MTRISQLRLDSTHPVYQALTIDQKLAMFDAMTARYRRHRDEYGDEVALGVSVLGEAAADVLEVGERQLRRQLGYTFAFEQARHSRRTRGACDRVTVDSIPAMDITPDTTTADSPESSHTATPEAT